MYRDLEIFRDFANLIQKRDMLVLTFYFWLEEPKNNPVWFIIVRRLSPKSYSVQLERKLRLIPVTVHARKYLKFVLATFS